MPVHDPHLAGLVDNYLSVCLYIYDCRYIYKHADFHASKSTGRNDRFMAFEEKNTTTTTTANYLSTDETRENPGFSSGCFYASKKYK